MRELQSYYPYLTVSGVERLKQVPVRLLLIAVMSWGLWSVGQLQWIAPWLMISCFVQIFEIWALGPFRKERPASRTRICLGLLSTFMMGSNFAIMSVLLWQGGNPNLVTLAALTLSGGLLTNIASSISSRVMFIVGGGPYLLGLLSMSVFETLTNGVAAGLMILVITALGTLSVMVVYVRVYTMRKTEILAVRDAEERLQLAQKAMAERAAMAAIVSHELRTPLSAIVAGAQIVRHETNLDRRNDTAELIIDAGRLMTGMLNDLLDHSKMEAGAMQLDRRDFCLNSFVADAGRFWVGAATQKGLAVEIEAPEGEALWLHGDAFRLRQIINNLMSNAVKFTPKGKVKLTAEVEKTGDLCHLTLTVQDEGIGITPDAMDRLFTPFSQASSEVARTYGGTGLGLSVSRDLAKLMGGDLVAFSEVGQGTSFVLSLIMPIVEAKDEAQAVEETAAEVSNNIRILAVDDHEVNRRTMALVLHPLDVDLTTACSGAEALEILAAKKFDVVLMDVNMPGLDGNETTRRLRSLKGMNQRVPVIGFSAATAEREIQMSIRSGMNDWISKPLEPSKLYEALQRALLYSEDQEEERDAVALG